MNQKRESDETVLILPGAAVRGDVTLGRDVSVWFNAVIRGDKGPIVIGAESNIQDGAVIHEKTVIGRGCTVGHGAIVHGCTIGDNTLIGMGAVVLNGARIGNNCLIGAGALVTGGLNAPDGSLIFGSPAKIIRPLTEDEIEHNRASAREYLVSAEIYRRENQLLEPCGDERETSESHGDEWEALESHGDEREKIRDEYGRDGAR